MELTPLSEIRGRTLIARHAHHRRHCCSRGHAGMPTCLRWCSRVGWPLHADPPHERSPHGHGRNPHVRNGRRHPYFASADRCRRCLQLGTLSACQPMRRGNQPRRFHQRKRPKRHPRNRHHRIYQHQSRHRPGRSCQMKHPQSVRHRRPHCRLLGRRQWDPVPPADAGEWTAEWAPQVAGSAWYRRSLRVDLAR